MLSYFVNTSRNTEQPCYFIKAALVWLTPPVVQTTWTSPRLKMGKSYYCPANSATVHMSLRLESVTLGTHLGWPHQDYASLKPPAVLWQSLACSQQSSVQGQPAVCCSACCFARPCWPFEMLGVRWPSDL